MASGIIRTNRRLPRAWTTKEKLEVKRMHDEGFSNVAIAKSLDRAQSSVAGLVKSITKGEEVKTQSFAGWTPEEDAQILDLRKEGLFAREIAQRVGRSHASVESRFAVLMMRKPNNPNRKERTCLCCQRVFMSAHSLNRICGRCGDRVRDVSPWNPGIHGSI